MAIIKQVQIETNGVLNDIGAKYDEAENLIRGTYGASLNLPIETEATGGTSIQLVAKDNTVLSTVNLELDASVISDGILPVEFGGTGVASLTENSVLIAGDDTVDEVTPTTAGGAFYAPADSAQQNPSPQTPVFGTLPVAYGGTGTTTFKDTGQGATKTGRGVIYYDEVNDKLSYTEPGSQNQVLVSQGMANNAAAPT